MLGIISFSNRIAYNIKSNEHKDLILEQLNNLYKIKILQKHHHDLNESNLKFTLTSSHMMNLRSNGNRYYLYFTLYNDIEIIYFIDKKIHPGYQRPRIILGRGLFDKNLFKNTLLDGEMVKCKDDSWTFLINDIIVYEGKYLHNKQLPERLDIIYHILEHQYTPDKTIDVCDYKVKNYYHMYKECIPQLIDTSKELNYTCRGIYIWSYDLRYKPKLYNFDETTIVNVVRKTKDMTEFQLSQTQEQAQERMARLSLHSDKSSDDDLPVSAMLKTNNIDIVCKEDERILYLVKTNEPDIYKIYETENILNTQSIGIALVQTLTVSKMLRNAFKDKNVMTCFRFKCAFDSKFGKWKPLALIS
jgi:hypothetical protein